jgi:hypothetical protein
MIEKMDCLEKTEQAELMVIQVLLGQQVPQVPQDRMELIE